MPTEVDHVTCDGDKYFVTKSPQNVTYVLLPWTLLSIMYPRRGWLVASNHIDLVPFTSMNTTLGHRKAKSWCIVLIRAVGTLIVYGIDCSLANIYGAYWCQGSMLCKDHQSTPSTQSCIRIGIRAVANLYKRVSEGQNRIRNFILPS